jgi:hypothetical protein
MDNQNQDEQTKSGSGLFSGGAVPPAGQTTSPAAPAVDDAPIVPVPDPAAERELLMNRARLLGVEFSNNIGVETLRKRINEKLDEVEDVQEPDEDDELVEPVQEAPAVNQVETNAFTGQPSNAPKMSLRQRIHDEQMRLIRIRVTCMDPKKKDLHGEIFTIANEYLGTVRKFVPFGEATEDGFHVPYCIYTMLEERRFVNIRTTRDRRTGSIRTETSDAREFAIEVLEPLTPAELARLATAQAAAGSID